MTRACLLSIIIPVYNEAATIDTVIRTLLKLKFSRWRKELIIVDDASTDETAQILRRFRRRCSLLTNTQNSGKGHSIRKGLQSARGDYVLIHDADLEYKSKDIGRLLSVVDKSGAAVVYGSRFLGKTSDMVPFHREANIFLTTLTNILYRARLTDMETCFKLIKRNLITDLKLSANRFEFEPEITAKLLKKGIVIKEIPIDFTKRGFSEGKKITFKDALTAIWILFRYRVAD